MQFVRYGLMAVMVLLAGCQSGSNRTNQPLNPTMTVFSDRFGVRSERFFTPMRKSVELPLLSFFSRVRDVRIIYRTSFTRFTLPYS